MDRVDRMFSVPRSKSLASESQQPGRICITAGFTSQGLKALDPVSLPLVAKKSLTMFACCRIRAPCAHRTESESHKG